MNNLRSNQRGTFAIEFALLGVAFSTMLLLAADTVVKLSIQGKLDRLSYSLVNVVKERTQLYGKDDHTLTTDLALELHNFAHHSLTRTLDTYQPELFGSQIEVLVFDGTGNPIADEPFTHGHECSNPQVISDYEHLSMVTSWGRKAVLYRVSLCYDVQNWVFNNDWVQLSSASIMMGR
ncbi:ATP-binding protein [Vibrio sp. SM6]|uniref:ATP-binding protein n=1 Tax=Vibrio agarilyticus TaxID=2726741 RepID=A0A7X8TS33_9VIBR|nr:ATP-binding protein [Vibrio agarilyticus]